jgi:protoporphyrinogen oxidase
MRHASRFLIIGAGPTGLGAAVQLAARGECDFVILEGSDAPGGLAASFRDVGGFTWDLGSHLHYSHYERVDRCWDMALGPDQWVQHQRSTWVWMGGRFVPYPLQLNLHRLADPVRSDCVRRLIDAAGSQGGTSQDFESWVLGTFGRGIAEHFMLPYNAKLWAYPLERMSARWIAQRVAVPDVEEVIRRADGDEDSTGWGPNATFRYPIRAGSGALWEAVAKMLLPESIRYRQRVVRVDPDPRIVCTADGAEYGYDYLISSMPLDQLAGILQPGRHVAQPKFLRRRPQYSPLAPREGRDREGQHLAERDAHLESRPQRGLTSLAETLTATATHVIGIGLEGQPPESIQDKLWIYYPDRSVSFYRVTIMSNLSPENTPRPGQTWSLMAEVSESPYRPLPAGDIIQQVILMFRSVGLLRPDDQIISRWHRRLSHGYPVPTLDRDAILAELLPALRDLGIYSRGRFGAWKYEVGNQDHAFMQGVEAVEYILHGHGHGHRELTLEEPDLINSRHNPFRYAEWGSPKPG